MNGDSWLVDTLRKRATLLAGALGVIGAAVGAILGVTTFWGVLLIGIGSALIAAALYTIIAEFREEFTERLLAQGLLDVFPSRLRRFDDGFWTDLIGSTKDHFRVLGVANHGYLRNEEARQGSRQALIGALERGVAIDILWLKPDDPVADAREREERRGTKLDISASIKWFWELREGLGTELQNRLHLCEHNAIPSCGLTWADDQLIVTHYIAGQNNLDSPGMMLSTSTLGVLRPLGRLRRREARRAPLAQAYMNTYTEVRSQATSLTAERVEEITRQRDEYEAGPSEEDLREELGEDK